MKAASELGDFHALHPGQREDEGGGRRAPRRPRPPAPGGAGVLPGGSDDGSDAEERVAEVIREKALHLTREEVPHAVSVEVEEIEERRVHALVYVETESQKGILVGKRGTMIREIGMRARPEVEALLGHPVFLELQVKVRPKWRRDPRMLERLGL